MTTPFNIDIQLELQHLSEVLDDALHLFNPNESDTELPVVSDAIQPSLFEQCIELCKQGVTCDNEPIRTIHHLSCTGGTLITKCLASMPNIMVFNEVDPLSTLLSHPGKPAFSPTDMVSLLRQGNRNVPRELLIKLFLEDLQLLRNEFSLLGKRILLRDHSHSHFLVGEEIPNRPTLLAIVGDRFPTRSIVTVRNPIDSFLSMQSAHWVRFNPPTFDEYCRRYLAFLDAYADCPVFRYEDFVQDPGPVAGSMCQALGFNYFENFDSTFEIFQFSGDSGRTGNVIEPRKRREYGDDFVEAAVHSENYHSLITRLKYSGIDN